MCTALGGAVVRHAAASLLHARQLAAPRPA